MTCVEKHRLSVGRTEREWLTMSWEEVGDSPDHFTAARA